MNQFCNYCVGYKFCHVDSDTNAGGVGIYIDEEIEFACENLYSFSKNGLENLWISINTSLTQNFVLGVVYRHPNANVKEFIGEFNDTLVKLNSKNANCIVLGDFNTKYFATKHRTCGFLY